MPSKTPNCRYYGVAAVRARHASLRHYEKQGLLKPHRYQNGYRDYSEAALLQVERIRWLLSAGLTTKAIRRMLPCVLEEGPAFIECPSLRRDLARRLHRLSAWFVQLSSHVRDAIYDIPDRNA